MNNFTGHFLISTTGAQSDYHSTSLAIRPGCAFNAEQVRENSILLAGGFPAIHLDSAFPLSPTLQLNGDLTNINEAGITALAQAEFTRNNSQSYRSYTVEADSRLTVLSADAASLHAFIDTYGGVLQIDPLLTKGYDPELATAREIVIEQTRGGLKLTFNVKHPIDLDRCSYCGACGVACPEQCLSEQLFLDFSRCTLCKECVATCPHAAIDLHVVEHRELITPALLPLEGAGIDLPEIKKNIYSEAGLQALFERIYAVEIDEVIGWDAAICQYSGRLKTGCSVCVDACGHMAISQSRKGVELDHIACVECGACLASCPTGALQYKRFDDHQFVEYFRTFPLLPGSTVVLGDAATLHKYWWKSDKKAYEKVFFLEYPQPAALHAMHFLFLSAMGAGQIIVLGSAQGSISNQIEITNSIIYEIFHKPQMVLQITTDSSLDRLLQEAGNSTVSVHGYHDFSFTNRRDKFMKLVQFMLRQSSVEPEILTATGTEYFGTVSCNEDKCTGCIACVGECRIGALTTDGETYSLSHTPALCVQCGICVTVCPENALTIQPGLDLREEFFSERVIAKTEPARCKSCGKVYGTKKSLEKVISILSAKGMWDKTDDLLSYCENCRVVNLYESSKNEQAKRIDR